jgi:hypothetical protein
MAVDIEIRLVAMHAFADVVGHPAHSQNVASSVQGKGVICIQSLSGNHLAVNQPETGVVSLE